MYRWLFNNRLTGYPSALMRLEGEMYSHFHPRVYYPKSKAKKKSCAAQSDVQNPLRCSCASNFLRLSYETLI
jgi:hypothetical protein